jgi:hypothetical protein
VAFWQKGHACLHATKQVLVQSFKGVRHDMNGADERVYFLGHSDAEVERLALQNEFYRDATEAVLRCAGLASGMRVLDIGCGVVMCRCLPPTWLGRRVCCLVSIAVRKR